MDPTEFSSDASFVSLVETILASPRTEHSSFTLHAPLEFLARVELLALVDSEARPQAMARIADFGVSYLQAGDAVALPKPAEFASDGVAAEALLGAVGRGEVEAADSAAAWLAENLAATEIARLLAGPLLHVFGAAAHAPILFAAWLRQPGAAADPLRGIARSLALSSQHVLPPENVSPPGRATDTPEALGHALSDLVKMQEPDWGIYGMVRSADELGVMATLPEVADSDIDAAFTAVLRVAARSMVEDDPSNAAYGWTHCLTLPLAVRQTAHLHTDQRAALDLATMFVAASRVAAASAPLSYTPPTAKSPHVITALASSASVRHDAHLVKYVLACHHSSELDPEAASVYLEAAGHLLQWWRDNPAPEDRVRRS